MIKFIKKMSFSQSLSVFNLVLTFIEAIISAASKNKKNLMFCIRYSCLLIEIILLEERTKDRKDKPLCIQKKKANR